jgi:hypothetical protein
MRSALARLLLVAALLPPSAPADAVVEPAPQSSAARLGSSDVTIDFSAVTDEGQPVLDLDAGDLALRVNGRARAITSLQIVRAGTPAGATPALPPPFATNVVSEAGRDVLLVLDDESIAPGREQPLKDAIAELLANLSPRDRVGLLSVRRGGILLNLSTDRRAIRTALTALRGQAGGSQTAIDLVCRTRTTLQALSAILGGIRGGSPATLVFFSAALASPDSERNARIGADSGLCQLRTEDFQEIAASTLRSQATFYVVHLLGGSGSMSSANSLAAGLEHLAGTAGGELIRLTGTNPTAVDRIARETAARYILAFEPDPSERTGATQPLELRVNRDRVRLRVRPAVTIPAPSARTAPPTPNELLRVADVSRELPLRAAAYPSRVGGDDKVKLVTLFEPADAGIELTSAAVGLFDERGRLTAQWTAEPADLARLPATAALMVAPGTYRLRVAAVDASGRAGTADTDVRAELAPADPVRLSGLVLGVPANGSFAPKLQFGADPAAVGYLEVYGASRTATVTARLELAASASATPMAAVPATVSVAGSDALRIAYAGFGITALPPGDFLVRAVVSVDGKEVGRAVHTLRKVAP